MERRPSHQISGDLQRRISSPEPAHVRDSTPDPDEDEREATELQTEPERRVSRIISKERPPRYWYDPAKRFWRHHIRISVPHVDCRDHLANERTFLGYLRTSVAISMMGITIEQLWRLQHSAHPDPTFGYYVLSKPLAAILQCIAFGNVLLGSLRFFRQQSAMARGKVHAGGWEIFTVMVFMFLFLFMLFALQLGLAIEKDM